MGVRKRNGFDRLLAERLPIILQIDLHLIWAQCYVESMLTVPRGAIFPSTSLVIYLRLSIDDATTNCHRGNNSTLSLIRVRAIQESVPIVMTHMSLSSTITHLSTLAEEATSSIQAKDINAACAKTLDVQEANNCVLFKFEVEAWSEAKAAAMKDEKGANCGKNDYASR